MQEDTPADKKSPGWRVAARIVAQIVALAAIVWVAYYFFDFEQVRLAFRSLSVTSIVVFVGIMMVVRVINSWRWLVIARRCLGIEEISLGFMTRVTLLAQFTNVWFPSFLGGEFVRIWKLGRTSEMAKEIPISVMLDRVVGVASLAVLCLPFLLLFPHFIPDVNRALESPLLMWGGIGFVVLVGGAAIWKRNQFIQLFRRSWRFFEENNYMVEPMLISMLGYSVIVVAYWFLLESLEAGSMLDIAAVTLIPRFGRVFPVSALGIGAVEGGTLVVGRYLGMGSQILVVIVAVHITSKYVASLLGALLEIGFEGRSSLRELVDQAEASAVAESSGNPD